MWKSVSAVLAAGLLLGAAGQGFAADEPENVIKYRQSVMSAIGGHAGAIAGVVKGEVSFDQDVAAHARGIAETAKLVRPELFPKGTDNSAYPNTRALPAIWEDEAKFMAAVKELQAQSAKFAEVAESGDMAAIGAQFQNLGKACGGCHKPFRAEKK